MKPQGEVKRGDIWNKAKSLGIKERTLADILRRFTKIKSYKESDSWCLRGEIEGNPYATFYTP